MTQEEKELLLKDLCARLPYEVKCKHKFSDYNEILDGIIHENGICVFAGDCENCLIEDIKPYLFPLSSMTEEQRKEYENAIVYHDYVKGGWTIVKSFEDEYIIPYWFIDFCNKHHLDYRGLIPMGLAIDATNKNIY